MVTKRGKVFKIEGIALPEGNIADTEDNYKYLGILQANGNHKEAARKAVSSFAVLIFGLRLSMLP